MTEQTRSDAQIRQQLLEMKSELQQMSVEGTAAASAVELDQSKVGRLSRMDALQGQAMAQATLQRRRHTLVLIEKALQRLNSGDYGRCADCDEWISPQRLAIDPVAEVCIQCAEAAEQ